MEPVRSVELRVHGVSGGPPEELLGRQLVRRVSGDSRAGFWRPELAEQRLDVPIDPVEAQPAASPPPEDAPALEGYSWGGLNSGAAARAFWLLLVPFTLANLAPRLRPPSMFVTRWRPTGVSVRRQGVALEALLWWLSRVLALGLTATMTLTAAGVGVSQLAWRCGSTTCDGLPWAVTAVLTAASPGVRLLLGALVPVMLLIVLVVLGRDGTRRYEDIDPTPDEAFADDDPGDRAYVSGNGDEDADGAVESGDGPGAPALLHPDFWRGGYLVSRLRQLHVVVAVAAIVHTVVIPIFRHDQSTGSPVQWFGLGLLVLVGVAVAGVIVLVALPTVTHRTPLAGRLAALIGRTFLIAVTLAVLTIAYALVPRPRWRPAGTLPGYDLTATTLFSAETLVVFGLAAVVFLLWRQLRRNGRDWWTRSPESPADRDETDPTGPGGRVDRAGGTGLVFGGYGTPLTAGLALLLAVGFSASVYVYVGVFIATGRLRPSFDDLARALVLLDAPPAVRMASLGFAFSAVWAVAVALVLAAWAGYRLAWPRRWKAGVSQLDEEYRGQPRNRRRDAEILRALWTAGLFDRTSAVLSVILLPVFAVTVALAGLVVAAQLSKPAAALELELLTATADLSALGTYGTVLTLLGLVALGAAAFRAPKTRRVVGVLWDVCAFWPRVVHPLAAPCYSERTVPELRHRLRWYAAGAPESGRADPAGTAVRPVPVILAGHSQGSVIAASVLMQLDPCERESIRLVTVGCVLHRIYGRFFPAYFGPDTIRALARGLTDRPGREPRWTNLWRSTDTLGGRVRVDGMPNVDRWLRDPRYATPPGDVTAPPTNAHSYYFDDPAFGRLVSRPNAPESGTVGPTGPAT